MIFNELDAISLALTALQKRPIGRLLDLSKPSARFIDGAKWKAELRAQVPPGFKLSADERDYWSIEFPLLEKDEVFHETHKRVHVYPATGEVEIVLDCDLV